MSQHAARGFFDAWNRRAFDEHVTFPIIDITGDRDVGVYWEVDVDGRPSGRRGVSFYKFDDDDRLVWALDAAEVLRELAGVDRIAHCGKILRDVRLMMLAGFNAQAVARAVRRAGRDPAPPLRSLIHRRISSSAPGPRPARAGSAAGRHARD